MKNTIFTGAATAIITPFNPDFSVNYTKLAELIEMQIAGNIDAIVTCGTTGESAVFSDEEHVEVMRFTTEKVAGRVPVIAGVGSNDTAYALWLTKEAEKMGVNGLLHVTPYYNKTSQKGLVHHFTKLADNTSLPIIVYNVPSRTGLNIAPATYKELSKHPNIVATKEAGGNISQVAETAQLCGDDLAIFSGNDDQIVPILSLGGKGVISVLSNIMPKQTHDICQLFFDGKVAESCALQLKLLPLINSLFCDVNPIPVKEAMNMMNLLVGPCREPLVEMNENTRARLKADLTGAGLI